MDFHKPQIYWKGLGFCVSSIWISAVGLIEFSLKNFLEGVLNSSLIGSTVAASCLLTEELMNLLDNKNDTKPLKATMIIISAMSFCFIFAPLSLDYLVFYFKFFGRLIV